MSLLSARLRALLLGAFGLALALAAGAPAALAGEVEPILPQALTKLHLKKKLPNMAQARQVEAEPTRAHDPSPGRTLQILVRRAETEDRRTKPDASFRGVMMKRGIKLKHPKGATASPPPKAPAAKPASAPPTGADGDRTPTERKNPPRRGLFGAGKR